MANLPYYLINRSTCVLGAVEDGARNGFAMNGFTLAAAVVEGLRHAYHEGISAINPLTGEESILRVQVAGIRADAVMVNQKLLIVENIHLYFLLDLSFLSQRNKIANLHNCNSACGCTFCLFEKPPR